MSAISPYLHRLPAWQIQTSQSFIVLFVFWEVCKNLNRSVMRVDPVVPV